MRPIPEETIVGNATVTIAKRLVKLKGLRKRLGSLKGALN